MSTEKIQILIDRQDILDCLTRFCRGMDRFDRAAYLSAFHDDAIVAAGPFVGGAAACYDWAQPMHEAGQILTQHVLLNHSVEIQGDTAHSETYYMFIARNHPYDGGSEESLMLAGGRYIDRLEKRIGHWKIALRTNIIEWSGLPPSLPLPFGDVPELGLNGISCRNMDDPSYSRPLVNKRAMTS